MPRKRQYNFIKNVDCVSGMAAMEPASIDVIVTDPPFAIDFKAKRTNYNRTASRVLEGYNEISQENYAEFSHAWLAEAYRVLKDTGSAVVFSGWNNLKDILVAIDDIGFVTVNHLIWKYQFGVATKRRFVTSHYHCLFLCKDDKKRRFFPDCRFAQADRNSNGGSSRYRDMEDVWVIKREYWNGDVKTPTKLPKEIIEKILSYTSCENDIVLDPFLGSGQVAVVAQMLNRKYVGFEIAPKYFEFAKERLNRKQYRIRANEKPAKADTHPLLFG